MDSAHYSFGPFRLFPSEHLLLQGETRIPLAPKAYDLLLVLVTRHGHLVTRDELMQAIWPDSFVEEINLTVNVSLLRKTLGDQPDGRQYIATVPKRGYRFDAVVCEQIPRAMNGEAPAGVLPIGKKVEISIPAVSSAGLLPSASEGVTSSLDDQGESARPFRWWWAIGIAAVAVAALVWLLYWKHASPSGSSNLRISVHSLAVLPFQPLESDANDEYLGLGMTDALITRLNGLPQVTVRPISAVRGFTTVQDPVAAGKTLGVDAVLDGTIQRSGDQTRVNVRLQRVANGEMLWSDSFDERTTSAFALEDAISTKLAAELTPELTPVEQERLSRKQTVNSQAYELYTKGRYFWNKRSVESVQQSLELFREAIEADPDYAAAYAGLADAYILAGSYGSSFLEPQVAMPKAKEAAEHALSLDKGSPEAHTSLAYIKLTYDWDWGGAEAEFKRALALNPGYVNAHHWYAHELMAEGRVEEAHEHSEEALALDPTDVLVNEHMAWHHLMAREYDRAIPQATKTIELDPGFVQAHRVLGLAYLYTGRSSEACAEFQKGVDLSHNDPVARAYLARCYALSHRAAEAHQILDSLVKASVERYISSAEIAAVYAALGDEANTLAWLDKAVHERASALINLKIDPVFDHMRAKPRFQAIVAQIHLIPVLDETQKK